MFNRKGRRGSPKTWGWKSWDGFLSVLEHRSSLFLPKHSYSSGFSLVWTIGSFGSYQREGRKWVQAISPFPLSLWGGLELIMSFDQLSAPFKMAFSTCFSASWFLHTLSSSLEASGWSVTSPRLLYGSSKMPYTSHNIVCNLFIVLMFSFECVICFLIQLQIQILFGRAMWWSQAQTKHLAYPVPL